MATGAIQRPAHVDVQKINIVFGIQLAPNVIFKQRSAAVKLMGIVASITLVDIVILLNLNVDADQQQTVLEISLEGPLAVQH